MFAKARIILLILALSAATVAVYAQTGHALRVEQAVPFGTVQGNLLLLGDYLVFVDQQQPDASFVVPKSAIENLSADGTTVSVNLREVVRNRTGEVRRLSFRMVPGSEPGIVTGWYGAGTMAGGAPDASSPGASSASPAFGRQNQSTYPARHNHTIGDCRGQLIIAPDQLAYESISDVSHSRRWQYNSIREIKNPNPYELEIRAFTGGNYKIFLDGEGINPADYKMLVERVTSARAGR
jgi:hypothetical protein